MILFIDTEKSLDQTGIKTQFADQEVFFIDQKDLAEFPKKEEIKIISIFVQDNLSAEILKDFPNLQLIACRSTGFDNLDKEFVETNGIQVCNVPSYGENTIAEHTFALILSLSRKLKTLIPRIKSNNFTYQDQIGFDLQNKTIGIVGSGKIGLHAIRIARGFGMQVQAFDIHQDEFLAKTLDFNYVDMQTLLKTSQIVSLHVPYNKHTHHLINRESLQMMPENSILINTARGALVDNIALLEALESGHLAGCGLDVIEGEGELENLDSNSLVAKIITKENVIFTPHLAFYTQEAQTRRINIALQNIQKFLENKPQNIVIK